MKIRKSELSGIKGFFAKHYTLSVVSAEKFAINESRYIHRARQAYPRAFF